MKQIVLMILCLSLIGCASAPGTKNNAVQDGGFLSSDPCGPPCFYRITPGLTTQVQVEQIISQNAVFQNCQLFDNTASGGSKGTNCDGGIGIAYLGDLVAGLSFVPSTDIFLKEAIDLYGPPDFVHTFSSTAADGTTQSGLNLYYGKYHMILGLEKQPGTQVDLLLTTLVTSIAYWSDDSYRKIQGAVEGTGEVWKGYGSYTVVSH